MPLLVKSLPLYVILLLCALKMQAQTTVPLFYEKAYLHTDRDIYTSGTDIWFKAYLLNAQNNKPINYSKNLYVELIGPGLNIVYCQTLRTEEGFANGDFKLSDTLSAGTYRMRAYTNWMRNFADKFIFEKNITIVNELQSKLPLNILKPVKRLKKKVNLAGIKDTLPTGPIVRFFPEGGYLVNDVTSVVALKAEDEFGRGITVQGDVIASSGRKVAKFSSDSLGMGMFRIRPDETQQYHAEIMINGQLHSFKLANPLHKGFVLSANTNPGTIVAEIDCNGFTITESGGSTLIIMAQHGGKTFYKERITLNSKSSLIQIPDTNCPEGIASITLLDEFARPIGERLVYVHHPDNPKLNISTDKNTYQPKQKVTVKIKLTDTTRTHLSLAVVDAGLVPAPSNDILSYLTLRSELKGTIEHPERYFDTTNINRFKQMDMLLLTQGWRAYLWQRLVDTIPKITYDVEQGLTLTGRVRKIFADKPLAGISITMFAPKAEGRKLFTAKTDANGRFVMDDAMIYGYQFLNFTSRRSDKINSEGEGKGRSGGWIQVDSLNQNQPAINPAIVYITDTLVVKPDSLLARDERRRKFSFKANNQLKTVQIKAYTNILEPIVQNVGLAEQKDYGSLIQYLLYIIPQAHSEEGGCQISASHIYTVLMTGYRHPYLHRVAVHGVYSDNSKIDYRNVCDEDYLYQPMTRIYKITIQRRQSVDGILYSVMVVLKPQSLDVKNIFDNNVADVTGYYRARQFFAPRYETADTNPDYRTTIHWEPNIVTNAQGEATITYYNADPKTNIRLIVQGITDKGVPVVTTQGYEVK